MTHHCPRSNWTGPESELRRGICPKCAVTTLYEDCQVRPMTDKPITFTDEHSHHLELIAGSGIPRSQVEFWRHATPDDLARAGYEPTTQALDRLAIEAAIVAEDMRRELAALRALADVVRVGSNNAIADALKAVDEARK